MTTSVTTPKSKRRLSTTDLTMQIFLLIIGLIVATPIIIALFTSFKSLQDISANPHTLLPREWTL